MGRRRLASRTGAGADSRRESRIRARVVGEPGSTDPSRSKERRPTPRRSAREMMKSRGTFLRRALDAYGCGRGRGRSHPTMVRPGAPRGDSQSGSSQEGCILGSAAVAIESLYYKGDRLDFPGLRFLHLIAHYSRAWNIGLLAVLAGGVVEIISIGRRRGWSRSILLGAVLAAALGALVLFGLINLPGTCGGSATTNTDDHRQEAVRNQASFLFARSEGRRR